VTEEWRRGERGPLGELTGGDLCTQGTGGFVCGGGLESPPRRDRSDGLEAAAATLRAVARRSENERSKES
jgi:hypothetical protein